jgi:hypothetical protein
LGWGTDVYLSSVVIADLIRDSLRR